MAKGDWVYLSQAKVDLGKKVHDLSADTLMFALITGAGNGGIDPAETMADPRWGAAGGVDLSAYEATPGGNYPAGGIALTAVVWSADGANVKLDSDDIAIAVNAANPTDGVWGIIYNNTAAGKQAIGYIDLGGTIDMTAGPFDYSVPAAGWMSLS